MNRNSFNHPVTVTLIIAGIFITAFWMNPNGLAQSQPRWKIHDMSRPRPAVIDPGTASTQQTPGQPPSDAIVLFDGKDLSKWRSMDGTATRWIVKDGYMEAVKGSGAVRTLQNFGDCQLHIEWATPLKVEGEGQGRGNSGVFLMGKYEVQVLDSYQNQTYADGQAAAIYGQHPPLVNACRKPGEWQIYDIIFHGPRFDEIGELIRPARMTILHNGVLVQDNVEVLGPTTWMQRLPYSAHRKKLPLSLQDHGNPVRYRNIWIRELPEPGQPMVETRKEITLPMALLDRYVGTYQENQSFTIEITREENGLKAGSPGENRYAIYAESETKFFAKYVDVQLEFHIDQKGKADSLTFYIGRSQLHAKRID